MHVLGRGCREDSADDKVAKGKGVREGDLGPRRRAGGAAGR